MAISHITDKLVAGEEGTYGTLAPTFTLNWGDVQSFSYDENENASAEGSVGTGHTNSRVEPGLYYVTGTLTTRGTKSSIENLLKALMGDVSVVTGTYTATTSPTVTSYTVKAQHNSTQVALITGLVFTNFTIEASTDGYLVLNGDYLAQKLELNAETITPVIPSDDIFAWLDVCGKWRTTNINATSYTVTGDWAVTPEEGRGLECVTVGNRRLIQRVIRNTLDVSADVDFRIDDTFEVRGYTDEKTSGTLELIFSRGTDNEHTISVTNAIESETSANLDREATVKEGSISLIGTDVSVVGNAQA